MALRLTVEPAVIVLANSGVYLTFRYTKQRDNANTLRVCLSFTGYEQCNSVDVSTQSVGSTEVYTRRLLGPTSFDNTFDLGAEPVVSRGTLSSGQSLYIAGRVAALYCVTSCSLSLRIIDPGTGKQNVVGLTYGAGTLVVFLAYGPSGVYVDVDSGTVDYWTYNHKTYTTRAASVTAEELDAEGNTIASATESTSVATVNVTGFPPVSEVVLVESVGVY